MHSTVTHTAATPAVRNRWCRFRHKIDATVAFVGALHIIGVVLGRMEDKRGRHYEILYTVPVYDESGEIIGSQQLRRWFGEEKLCELDQKVSA